MIYRAFSALAIAGLILAMASTPSAQNNWLPHLKALPPDAITPAKTAEGWPDLQGTWNVVARIGGPQHSLEYGIDPEAVAIHNWNPAARGGSVVIDPPNGRIPYNAKALEKRNENLAGVYIPTKRSHLDPEVRCLLGGVPRGTLQGTEIRYAPPYVAFVSIGRTSDQSFTRIIPMDGRPWPNEQLKLWRGISRGHFDGNTLVVETRNQNDKTWFDSHGSFHSDQMRVIERLTLVDADDALLRGDDHRSHRVYPALEDRDDVESDHRAGTFVGRRVSRRGARFVPHARGRHSCRESRSQRSSRPQRGRVGQRHVCSGGARCSGQTQTAINASMPLLHDLAQRVQEMPLSIALRESLWMYPIIETAHVLGLCLFVGTAWLWDFRLLGWTLRRVPVSELSKQILPWTAVGLCDHGGERRGPRILRAAPVLYQHLFPYQARPSCVRRA